MLSTGFRQLSSTIISVSQHNSAAWLGNHNPIAALTSLPKRSDVLWDILESGTGTKITQRQISVESKALKSFRLSRSWVRSNSVLLKDSLLHLGMNCSELSFWPSGCFTTPFRVKVSARRHDLWMPHTFKVPEICEQWRVQSRTVLMSAHFSPQTLSICWWIFIGFTSAAVRNCFTTSCFTRTDIIPYTQENAVDFAQRG
jgi:hypothetical protein